MTCVHAIWSLGRYALVISTAPVVHLLQA